MNLRTHKRNSTVIVYDADHVEQADAQLFDAGYWAEQNAVCGEAEGRGTALFLETPFGPAVLKMYLRGGLVAKFNRDRYLFTGYRRSRPLAEIQILARLQENQLPAPVPLAAMCVRSGLYYRGGLLTRTIPDTRTLTGLLTSGSIDDGVWRDVGRCIRRFHDIGVIHADLNARNILVGADGQVYLIDFDRARIRAGSDAAFKANLARLRRSLHKVTAEYNLEPFDAGWSNLVESYEDGTAN